MSEAPVLHLTAAQSELLAEADCAVELRDHLGKTIGYLLHRPEITRFYTPQDIADLQRRAANRTGRTLDEIMADIRARMES